MGPLWQARKNNGSVTGFQAMTCRYIEGSKNGPVWNNIALADIFQAAWKSQISSFPALVQLSQPINASSDIRPVHISRDPPKSGRLCRVPLKDKVPLFSNDTRPSVTSLPVPLLSVAECNGESQFNSWMTGRMGCAKRVEDNRLCQVWITLAYIRSRPFMSVNIAA